MYQTINSLLVFFFTNMNMLFKKSRGRYYLQLVDDLGFIYHIGPANLENLAVCAYTKGLGEKSTHEYRSSKLLANKGFENLTEAVKVHENAYWNGTTGFKLGKIKNLDMVKCNEKYTEVYDRQKIHEMLYRRCMETNETLTHNQIRKWVQDKMRNSSEEEYIRLLEEADRKLNEALIRALDSLRAK